MDSINRICLRPILSAALIVTLVLGPCAPIPVAAQQQSAPKMHVDVNLVLVDVTVKDKSGRLIDGLTQQDFEVRQDGVPQTISHFSRYELPLAAALVVDLSSSIQPFLRPLRYATSTALRTLKPEDEVALFTFAGHIERPVSLTRDRRAVSDQIESFQAGGSTNINGAVFEAAQYLQEAAPSARRVIILVSDNVPTDSGGVSPHQVEDAALEADAALYSLKIPGNNPVAVRIATKLKGDLVNVSKLATDTGGEIFDVEKEGSLYLAFEALIQRLKTRYTLAFTPTPTTRDGRFHKLEVRLVPSHGATGRDYTLLARQGYFAR